MTPGFAQKHWKQMFSLPEMDKTTDHWYGGRYQGFALDSAVSVDD